MVPPVDLLLQLEHSAALPLREQLYRQLRKAILSGGLRGGTRLPATRQLATQLHVARQVVVEGYDQLLAEGYLEARWGSGTYVAKVLPEHYLDAPLGSKNPGLTGERRTVSRRATALTSSRVFPPVGETPPRPFRPGLPALDAFPYETWSRLTGYRLRRPSHELTDHGDPIGFRPLREAIADYLASARAIRCTPEQVIVTAGSQPALSLAARVLLDPGDSAWIEDPGYFGARAALRAAEANLIPVPVDEAGLDVSLGLARCPEARLAYVTPSHQFAIGTTLSLERRLALLEWARSAAAWILEDDYDSEFRYSGPPLAALQGLDPYGRVIYVGTFSKVLLPSLRLGYLVSPVDLVDTFCAARAFSDHPPPSLEQAVLADFIGEGHFARHIRRMRGLYAERQAALVQAAARDLRGLLDVAPQQAGMHLVGWLSQGLDDRRAAQAAAALGVESPPLSSFCIQAHSPALLLGYTAFSAPAIREGVQDLARALKQASMDTPAPVL